MTVETTPPFYVRVDGGGTGERMGEPLARWESAHDAGFAEAGTRLLYAALHICQDVMTDGEVRATVEEALKAPRAVFGVDPKVPEWSRGLLEDDARFRQLSDAELTVRVKIPAKFVALVRDGVLTTMVNSANEIDSANWRRDAWRRQRCVELVDMLDAHRGAGPIRLVLDDGQAMQLARAIEHTAGRVEDDARAASDGAEILKLARIAAKLRALGDTITAAAGR